MPMKTLMAFKLVRMVQDEHRTEAEFEGTGAEGRQEITLILNNIDAQEVDLQVGARYTLDIKRFYPEERISAKPEHWRHEVRADFKGRRRAKAIDEKGPHPVLCPCARPLGPYLPLRVGP
ncbi:hypothetical protein [Microvirga sp. VF16]|uniref:hypothetical protein n=1 Tax=Microvirga sp. VF16 TaxID=2807101 RepID=UPI00193D018E|nr:hypothetical protein [Microvirga sp. VF16]QRM33447.1 hypothetical protein JO965_35960 [Microvirga sp. VF16]